MFQAMSVEIKVFYLVRGVRWAHVIALGAGLLTNTPAGAGAFDPTLIAILAGHE